MTAAAARPAVPTLTPALPAVTDDTFAREVLASATPVVVDLWAAWCGPCHQLRPVLEELAVELAGRLRVVTLDTDANPVTATQLRVLGLPTLKVFREGVEIGSLTGARSRSALREQLVRILDLP